MSSSEMDALIAFRAFTGNDFVSSFIRKGKSVCWKIMKQSIKFESAFHHIGNTWELSEDQLLEEYTCSLYGYRRNDINSLRSEMFTKKYNNENEAIDISVLPPCRTVLILHCKSAKLCCKNLEKFAGTYCRYATGVRAWLVRENGLTLHSLK